jgi:hypothetical protein
MLQEMGLDRDACTEYLATSGALAASGVENDAFRVTSNYLNHHVQSSKWIQLVVLYTVERVSPILLENFTDVATTITTTTVHWNIAQNFLNYAAGEIPAAMPDAHT